MKQMKIFPFMIFLGALSLFAQTEISKTEDDKSVEPTKENSKPIAETNSKSYTELYEDPNTGLY